MGFACCTLPCLLLTFGTVWIGLRKPRTTGDEWPSVTLVRAVWLALAFLFLGLAAWTGWQAQAHIRPSRYVPSIAARAEPLIAAIDAYDAGHGCPPTALSELVPHEIDAIPTPAWGIAWTFDYQYVSSLTQPRWKLLVWTSWSFADDSTYYFDSWSRRWGYSPR